MTGTGAPASGGLARTRRILVVRLGSMGDIVHALPLLASLRAEWPGAEIGWLVDRRHRPLLDLVRGVSDAIPVDTRRLVAPDGWTGTLRVLRRRRYDLVIDAQGLIKSAVLARASGAPTVVGFSGAQAREALASRFYTVRTDAAGALHVVDRGLALALAAGVHQPVRRFDLAVPALSPVTREAVAAVGDPFVVLNPGAGWPNKRWPAERFGALAARIAQVRGARSLVLWGPGEEEVAREVVARAGDAASMAPPTSLADLVAILARAGLVVAGDTGPLHLAAALGTPVVGIFGPTDPRRNGPWAPADESVSRHDRCACVHKRRCTAARWCLDDLGIDEVAQAVERRLTAAVAGGPA